MCPHIKFKFVRISVLNHEKKYSTQNKYYKKNIFSTKNNNCPQKDVKLIQIAYVHI